MNKKMSRKNEKSFFGKRYKKVKKNEKNIILPCIKNQRQRCPLLAKS